MDYKQYDDFKIYNTNGKKTISVPTTVRDTLIRNLQQTQYPNSKLREPINNFTYFIPDENNKKPYEKLFYMEDYTDKRVLEYKQPQQEEICIKSKSPISRMSIENEKIYKQTKHKKLFPVPIPTLGTNNLNKLNNPDINKLTSFNYTKYSKNNNYYLDNPIYYSPISNETIEQYNNFIDSREIFRNNLIKGIIEDMEILSTNEVNKEDNNIFQ